MTEADVHRYAGHSESTLGVTSPFSSIEDQVCRERFAPADPNAAAAVKVQDG